MAVANFVVTRNNGLPMIRLVRVIRPPPLKEVFNFLLRKSGMHAAITHQWFTTLASMKRSAGHAHCSAFMPQSHFVTKCHSSQPLPGAVSTAAASKLGDEQSSSRRYPTTTGTLAPQNTETPSCTSLRARCVVIASATHAIAALQVFLIAIDTPEYHNDAECAVSTCGAMW